jgi:Ca2+-binding RTX toxin-like protein
MQKPKWLRAAVGMGALALAVLGPGTPTVAADSVDAAVWLMTETSGTTMSDSSGNGNDGTTYNVTMTGETGYVFDPVARSKVVVPDSPTLHPGASAFSYSVEMQSDHAPASGTDYDLLRKGIGTTTGGEYKLEIVYANGQGRAFCLVTDSFGTTASIKGTTNVTDGQVHNLTCTKTATGVTLQVDALTPRTKTVSAGLGPISNTSPMVIGAKTPTVKGTAGDWYNGALLQARISAAARTCMGLRATIVGTGGVDTIHGTRGADVIVGLAGADIIRGRGGNDTICGGAGADRIRGGTGNDRLLGGIGADVIHGGSGVDRISGGPGSDTCFSPKHAPGCEL